MFNIAYTPLISLVLGLSLAASALQGLPTSTLDYDQFVAGSAQGLQHPVEANMT